MRFYVVVWPNALFPQYFLVKFTLNQDENVWKCNQQSLLQRMDKWQIDEMKHGRGHVELGWLIRKMAQIVWVGPWVLHVEHWNLLSDQDKR